MPTYKLIPTGEEQYDPKTLREGVIASEGSESSRNPPRGMVSSTFGCNDSNELCWVEFGWEHTFSRPTWDGTETYTAVQMYPIQFLQNGFVAHLNARNEVTDEIRSHLHGILDSDIVLEHVEFDPNSLLAVIEEADSVNRVDVAPADKEEPEYLAAMDRGDLRDTRFIDEYVVEPFERVKISVPNHEIDVKVGFDKTGAIILYGQNMPLQTQAVYLRYVCDELIDEYLAEISKQGSLSMY